MSQASAGAHRSDWQLFPSKPSRVPQAAVFLVGPWAEGSPVFDVSAVAQSPSGPKAAGAMGRRPGLRQPDDLLSSSAVAGSSPLPANGQWLTAIPSTSFVAIRSPRVAWPAYPPSPQVPVALRAPRHGGMHSNRAGACAHAGSGSHRDYQPGWWAAVCPIDPGNAGRRTS